jgi:hypothetical protein
LELEGIIPDSGESSMGLNCLEDAVRLNDSCSHDNNQRLTEGKHIIEPNQFLCRVIISGTIYVSRTFE